ncbi:hypothetical protein YC2023_095453 [Brassica napus]
MKRETTLITTIDILFLRKYLFYLSQSFWFTILFLSQSLWFLRNYDPPSLIISLISPSKPLFTKNLPSHSMISLVSPTEPFSLYKRNRTGLSVSVSPDSRVVVVVARIGSFVDQKLSHMVPPLRKLLLSSI